MVHANRHRPGVPTDRQRLSAHVLRVDCLDLGDEATLLSSRGEKRRREYEGGIRDGERGRSDELVCCLLLL